MNEIFEPDLPDEFIHYYNIVYYQHSDRVIDGLHFTFVELPKFKPHNFSEKKMQVLWLRFLTEINEKTRAVPAELQQNAEISKALSLVEESAYSDAQMEGYDKFWDAVRVERTLINDVKRAHDKALAQGRAEGMAQGRAEGMAEGKAEGTREANIKTAKNLKRMDLSVEQIARATGLSTEEILRL